MKTNIVIGGLLGIALGAGAMFAVAHGVLDAEPADSDEAVIESEGVVESDGSDVAEAPRAPVRPLRPGSARIGRTPAKPVQS